jgi:hypothetical protein
MVPAPDPSVHAAHPVVPLPAELGLEVPAHISDLVTYELESGDGARFLSFSYGVNDTDVDSVAATVYTDADTTEGTLRRERTAFGPLQGHLIFARRAGERPHEAMFAIAKEQQSAVSLWLTTTDANDEQRFRQTVTSFRAAEERLRPVSEEMEWHRVGRFSFAAPIGLRIHAAHFFNGPEQVRVDWEPDCDAATTYVLGRRPHAQARSVDRTIAGHAARFVMTETLEHVERLGVTPFGTRCLAVTYRCNPPKTCSMSEPRWDALYASALRTATPP